MEGSGFGDLEGLRVSSSTAVWATVRANNQQTKINKDFRYAEWYVLAYFTSNIYAYSLISATFLKL